MTSATLQSPFVTSSVIWSAEDQATFNTAYERARQVESEITEHLSCIIYSPPFEGRFPSLFSTLTKWIFRPHPSDAANSVAEPTETVTRHLQKETIEISIEFAKKINATYIRVQREILELTERDPDAIDFATYLRTSQFFKAYQSFLVKNKSDCQSPVILDALTKGLYAPKQLESCNFSGYCDDLAKAANLFDGVYLSCHRRAITENSLFISTIGKIVLIATEALVEPDQIRWADTDHSLKTGLGMAYNLQTQQKNQVIKEITSREAFHVESVGRLEKVFGAMQEYSQITDENGRFPCALKIINNFHSDVDLPVSLMLHVFCVASRNSTECPQYFQRLAIELSRQALAAKKKSAEEKGRDECVIS